MEKITFQSKYVNMWEVSMRVEIQSTQTKLACLYILKAIKLNITEASSFYVMFSYILIEGTS